MDPVEGIHDGQTKDTATNHEIRYEIGDIGKFCFLESVVLALNIMRNAHIFIFTLSIFQQIPAPQANVEPTRGCYTIQH